MSGRPSGREGTAPEVTDRLAALREAIRRPLPLGYHPLYRFYRGGSLTRAFRDLPERPDDWWSEDWVGSCTRAGHDDPDGRPQGLSPVEVPGLGPVALGEIITALPEEMVHRTEVHPGEVYVAHAGVPHYLGPRISFIEVQEPSDHIVIPETDGTDDAGATMGLGWELALDMIDYTGTDAGPAFARARQQPRELRVSGASREVRLLHDDALPYFDATALEVADEIDVSDERFSIAIVISGAGSIDGDFGTEPVRRGQTFALPASLPIRVRAGREAVRVIRCLGPAVA